MELTHTAVAALACLLVGCATVPTPKSDTERGKRVGTALTTATPGSGGILVKRDSGFIGSGCTHRIHVDGEPAAELRAGQAIVLYAMPGEHVVSAVATGICDGISEAAVLVEIGRTKRLRSGYDGNGNIRLQPTAF